MISAAIRQTAATEPAMMMPITVPDSPCELLPVSEDAAVPPEGTLLSVSLSARSPSLSKWLGMSGSERFGLTGSSDYSGVMVSIFRSVKVNASCPPTRI